MRSVSLYLSGFYKYIRIIKKDFDVNQSNYPRESCEKTYKANALINIISKEKLVVNRTTRRKNTVAFLTN